MDHMRYGLHIVLVFIQIIQHCMEIGFLSTGWKRRALQAITKDAKYSAEDLRTRVADLQKHVKQLIGVCGKLLVCGKSSAECNEVTIRVLCDVLYDFSPSATNAIGIDEVMLEGEENLLKILVRFVKENVLDIGKMDQYFG